MFIDHIVLMVSDVKRAEAFYSAFLGTPVHRDEESVAYQIGNTKIFLALPYHELPDSSFNKDRLGLNHLALGVRSLRELKQYEQLLVTAKIKHSGVQIDKYGGKKFIWFDDPDGIRLEFYLRDEKR